jgi:hypothetical protein
VDSDPNRTIRQPVDAGSTVVVTIGRNIGSEPLADPIWDEFTNQIHTLARTLLDPKLLFVYEGTGEWEGVTEQSRAFHFVQTSRATDRATLRSALVTIAENFGQDAIAFTTGPSLLARTNVKAPQYV